MSKSLCRWMMRLPISYPFWLSVLVWIGVVSISLACFMPSCYAAGKSNTATTSWITPPRPRQQRSTITTPQRKSSTTRIKGNQWDGSLWALLADTTTAAEQTKAPSSSSSYYFGSERERGVEDTTTAGSSSSTTGAAPSPTSIFSVRRGPDPATKPKYDEIVGPLGRTVDQWMLQMFRSKLAAQVGWDSKRHGTDYLAVPELALLLTQQFAYNTTEVQRRSVQVLLDLFPSWLPRSYAVLFSRPFPQFAARMNAWATWVAGTWLMGECKINDLVVVVDDSSSNGDNNNNNAATTTLLRGQGLLVQRCRFLEEAGCASVCVHACQIPTQTFFQEHMGLPLRMEPNYDTFECQFSFGLAATVATNAAAKATPCLARCPATKSLRQNHPSGTLMTNIAGVATAATSETISNGNVDNTEVPCAMMGDTE